MDACPTRTRITGCLGRAESYRLWNDLAETVVRLGVPYRIGREKWGRGWALYAVPIADESPTGEFDPRLRAALSAMV